MRWILVLGMALFGLPAWPASLPKLVEPVLHLPASRPGITRVALTFDACDGLVDRRILDVLQKDNIQATIFVTGKWLARNPAAFAEMLARPDLFEIENHGARHLPAVEVSRQIYRLWAAGSPAAVMREVSDGTLAIASAGGVAPHWFRGATGQYDAGAMADIRGLGLEIAGFSLNADQGASLPAGTVFRRIAGARDGDVIIAHINQPKRAAGAGVVQGIAALRARGVEFVRLQDVLIPAAGTGR